MKLIDQVCSLIHAKKLKEIGVTQESYFVWYKLKEKEEWNSPSESWQIDDPERFDTISAFTATELLNILPNSRFIPNAEPFDYFKICIKKFISVDENMDKHNNFILNYECDTTETTGKRAWMSRKLTSNMYDPNLANVCADMLIYLISDELMPK